MKLTIPSISKEYVKVEVTADADPTGNAVEFAFESSGTEPSSWTAGSWDGSATQLADGRYQATAQVLVGPSTDFALSNGQYEAWVRVTAGSEVPARRFAVLTVT